MAPRKGTKKSGAAAQSTLSFQARKSSLPSPAKKRTAPSRTSTIAKPTSTSLSSIPSHSHSPSRSPSPSPSPASTQTQKRSTLTRHASTPALKDAPALDSGEVVESITDANVASTDVFGSVKIVDPKRKLDVMLKKDGERDTIEMIKEKRKLDVKSKAVKGLMVEARKAMGNMEPIHAGPETHNDVHHILRVFDMTSAYGPCVGMSRLQRWERAKKWGLNPPEEIRSILTTVEGQQQVDYRENVLHGWV